MLTITEDRPEKSLRQRFFEAARPWVAYTALAVPLAGGVLAGLGYATQAPKDETDKYLGLRQTNYSGALDKLRQEYIDRAGGKMRIAIIDPDQYQLLLAFGKTPDRAVTVLARHQDVQLDWQQASDAADQSRDYLRYYDEGAAKTLGKTARTGFSPAAIADRDKNVCVYLPYEFRSDLLETPPGWTAQDVAEFASRHELTHCLDARYAAEEDKAVTPGEKFAAALKREMYADISGLGEMILHGRDPAIIDGIVNLRRTDRSEHFDVAGLLDLRSRLSSGGVGAFRKLDDAARMRFYQDITDKNALDAPNAQAFYDLEHGNGSLRALRKQPALAPAVQLWASRAPEAEAVSPHYSRSELKEIEAYDPLTPLAAAAGNVNGLIQRRAEMIDTLRQENTPDKVYIAKLEKLGQAFAAEVKPDSKPPQYAQGLAGKKKMSL